MLEKSSRAIAKEWMKGSFVVGCDYKITLAGNPNTGKSTIFNSLTGMHQHTGNWPGKTVTNAAGECHYKDKDFLSEENI